MLRDGITAQNLLTRPKACLEAAPLHAKRVVFMLGNGPTPAHRRPHRRKTPAVVEETAE